MNSSKISTDIDNFCESKVSSTLLQRVDETNDTNNYVAVSVMHNDYSKIKNMVSEEPNKAETIDEIQELDRLYQ